MGGQCIESLAPLQTFLLEVILRKPLQRRPLSGPKLGPPGRRRDVSLSNKTPERGTRAAIG